MAKHQGDLFFDGNGAGMHRQRYTVGHADFTAAAVAEALSMAVTLPAGTVPICAALRCPTPFTGGTISAATMAVGINGGNLDVYVAPIDVFTAALAYQAAVGDGTAVTPLIAATTIDITLTATGDNVVNAVAGEYTVDIYYARVTADPDPVRI